MDHDCLRQHKQLSERISSVQRGVIEENHLLSEHLWGCPSVLRPSGQMDFHFLSMESQLCGLSVVP